MLCKQGLGTRFPLQNSSPPKRDAEDPATSPPGHRPVASTKSTCKLAFVFEWVAFARKVQLHTWSVWDI